LIVSTEHQNTDMELLAAWEARLPAPIREAVGGTLRGCSFQLNAGTGTQGQNLPSGWRVEPDLLGGRTLFGPGHDAPSRWAEWDRYGTVHAIAVHSVAVWRPFAAPAELDWAAVRLPPGGWALWEPGTARHPVWGRCDRVGLPGQPASLTRFAAQPCGQLHHIPALERPAALPPGAGEALLNLLAAFMADQQRERVHYRGPYPTAHLFDVLCRSFTPLEFGPGVPEGIVREDIARERFARNAWDLALAGGSAENPVAWKPAPWRGLSPAPGLLLRVRELPESLWIGEVPFRAAAPGSPRVPGAPLAAGERLWRRDQPGEPEYSAGLALLGDVYREYVRLDAQGSLLFDGRPNEAAEPLGPLSAPWHAPLFAWATLQAAPALAPGVLALGAGISLRWARLPLTLIHPAGGELWLHAGLAEQFARLRPTRDPGQLALMAFSDVASAAAPHLHRRAQALLEAQAPADMERLVMQGAEVQQRARATLAEALPLLVASIREGEGLG
jgi:hypothetical protein